MANLDNLNLRMLIGMREDDAQRLIHACGGIMRVTRRDKNDVVVTRDLRRDRINVHVENGRVTKASIG